MISVINKKTSKDGSVKYLYKFKDKALAEAIRFKYNDCNAICISTLIGCNVGCVFCASTNYKFKRQITTEEMIEMVTYALTDSSGLKYFDEVAFQGTGEPLINLDNISKAAKKMIASNTAKDFSLATSGIVKLMPLVADTPIKKMYISLHATTDETRTKLIPTNRTCGIDNLIKLSTEHVKKTGIKATANYLLLKGINDSDGDLLRLTRILDPKYHMIQLLVINKTKDSHFIPSDRFEVFKNLLEKSGFEVSILVSCGKDIDGGCGQMISRYLV